jgi:hypothetical protein
MQAMYAKFNEWREKFQKNPGMRSFAATCGSSISAIRSIRSPHGGSAKRTPSGVFRRALHQGARR